MASDARYDKSVDQIKADLVETRGRTLSTTRIDQMLTVASDYFLGRHPDGWSFVTVQATSAAATESLSIQTDAGALGSTFTAEPRISGLWIVKTQAGASTGSWKPLTYKPWMSMSNHPDYNRTTTAVGGVNQKWWSIKNVGTATADKFNTITLETFPNKYTGTTDVTKLFYQVDWFRKTPTIIAGTSADDAFIWDEVAWDYIIIYLAEAMVAHELGLLDKRDGAWFLARTLLYGALTGAGVDPRKIHLPPPWLARKPEEVNL